MNNTTAYEQLITWKLDDMPVPDMADAIWARIERQLDIDMPTDDGGTDPDPKGPSGGGWMLGSGLFAFVAALVTIYLINNNKSKSAASEPVIPTTIQRIDSFRNNNVFRDDPDQTDNLNNKIFNNKSTDKLPGVAPGDHAPVGNTPTGNQDTIAVVPQVFLPAPLTQDTIQQVTRTVPPPERNDTVPPKRTRGVKGITDNDYRIVLANKDSS